MLRNSVVFFTLLASIAAQSLTSSTLTLPPRAVPSGAVPVGLTVVVEDLPVTVGVEAYFTGDSAWGSPGSMLLAARTGNSFTFTQTLTAPAREGIWEDVGWAIRRMDNLKWVSSKRIEGAVDVTCSDGVYCNGVERYVKQQCQASQALPCADPAGNLCATYACIETNRSCARAPVGGPSCARCMANACSPSCKNVVCGDDGCGGSCGACPSGEFCVAGVCGAVTALGSCANPHPLLEGGVVPDEGKVFDVFGSNVNGLDMTQPVCNSPGIKEYVYTFTVNVEMGFEIRMTRDDGYTGVDTLLAIHDAGCRPLELTAVDLLCSDDQTPPGNVASRVDGKLPPGTYTVIATAYASSTTCNFKLAVKFTPGCMPKCESKFCGDDDCGGSCGGCGTNEACFFGRCQMTPCLPNCHSRKCGADGCGGTCGSCKNKQVCDLGEGVCVPIKPCDPKRPACQGTGSANDFCGSDCLWHKVYEDLPDLVVNDGQEMLPTTFFQWMSFGETACAVLEGCVNGPGARLLMRFDTRVHNVGTADFVGPKIGRNPDMFMWSPCHQHYHFEKFARFNLYKDGALAVPGAKLSYCMEDAEAYHTGSTIPCSPSFDCLDQGIPRGRTDNYPGTIDCQWLDITDLPASGRGCWYTYEVCTNIGRTIMEMDFDNNCQRFPIYVPRDVDPARTLSYAAAVQRDNAMSVYPNGCLA